MKKSANRYFIFFAASVRVMVSCDSQKEENDHQGRPFRPDSSLFVSSMKELLRPLDTTTSLELHGVTILSSNFTQKLYEKNEFLPFWTDINHLDSYLKALDQIHLDGLNPTDYDLASIIDLREQLKRSPQDPQLAAAFDLITTNSFLLFSLHLATGKSDPVELDPNWNYDFFQTNPGGVDTVFNYLSKAELGSFFQNIRSRSDFYLNMRETIKDLYEKKQQGGWDSIDFEGITKIEPGDSNAVVKMVRKRLLPQASDEGGPYYDTALVTVVEDFQLRHGLAADGVIGKGTMDALNYTVDYKIDKVRANMERARWLVSDLTEKLVVVNIASFTAYLIQGDSMLFSSKIMVGKTYTKTPVFQSILNYAEFNPTWTIPNSILYESTIPKLRSDPGYLARNNMRLLNYQGEEVALEDVDLEAEGFSYLVRQDAGPRNPLGQVKFIFPNDFSVYLHDTSSRHLFARNERAFSHGCVRLDQPLKWAQVLLNDPDLDASAIRDIVDSRETQRKYPKEKVRIMILYLTHITENKTKAPYYYEDVYDRDQKILSTLENPMDRGALAERIRRREEKTISTGTLQ